MRNFPGQEERIHRTSLASPSSERALCAHVTARLTVTVPETIKASSEALPGALGPV